MRDPMPTDGPRRRWWLTAWRTLGSQPATGRSFLVVIIIATVASIAVTIWTFCSSSTAKGRGGAPSAFRI